MWRNVIDSNFFLPQPLYTIGIISQNKLGLYKEIFNQCLARTIICTKPQKMNQTIFFILRLYISKYF